MSDYQTIDQQVLLAETSVRTIQHHAVLDSTNKRAAQLLDASPELPLLVIADEQTAGRGRGGNSWWSSTGALLFSLVISRSEAESELPPYSLAVGLGVRDALAAASPDFDWKVKWPNDLFLEGRKVCGILIEVPPAHRDKLIIGIGINVNNSSATAPDHLAKTIASMVDYTGHLFSRTSVLSQVVQHVTREVANISGEEIADRWNQHCWLTGKTVSIQRGDRIDTGVCCGISAAGAILLQTVDGEVAISSGVVTKIS